MSNYKNPYVRLERLSFSVDRFLSISHASLEKQQEETDGEITEEENESQPRRTKPIRETGRPSRSAKRKVKTYCFENVSDDETDTSSSTDPEDDESDSERGSNYSNESEFEFNPHSKSKEKKGKRQKIEKVKMLTEYEKLILKNKNEKNAFLDALKIDEVKEGFSDAIKDYKKVGRKKRTPQPRPKIIPRLKIARSTKVYMDLSEAAIVGRTESEAMKALEATQEKKIVEELPARLHLQDVINSDQSYECFLRDLKDLDKGNTEPIDQYESLFQDMKLLESRIPCFTNTRLTAMDIHPMRENTIIAAGGDNGNLYLWNTNSDSKPYAFQVHSKRISRLKFIPENPHLIMSASSDGTLREGDLVANVYNKLTKDTDCNYFDFLSPGTCLVSHNDGYVSVVDMRDMRARNRKRRMAHKCHNIGIKSVSVHPVNKNEFITPSSKGCVKLWDLRKLQEHPVMEVQHKNHNESVKSAIFSPLTGKSVLTTVYSGRICVFDTSLWNITSSCKLSIKRPPHSQATWQPRTDRNFTVGSLKLPKEIEIWNYKQKICSASHELLQGLISFCTFHPSLPIIAAVTSSKIYVFANKDH